MDGHYRTAATVPFPHIFVVPYHLPPPNIHSFHAYS